MKTKFILRLSISLMSVLICVFILSNGSLAENHDEYLVRGGYPNAYPINELPEKWEGLGGEQELLIKNMRTSSNPKAAHFLTQVALGGIKSESLSIRLFAVSSIASLKSANAKSALIKVLNTNPSDLDRENFLKVRARAAYELLYFSAVPKEKIYEILNESAKSGVVYCPYPQPKDDGAQGGRKTISLNAKQKLLLHSWAQSMQVNVRLDAIYCLDQAGVNTGQYEPFVDSALKTYPDNSLEHSTASRIKSSRESSSGK